jgi:hypothetical protein
MPSAKDIKLDDNTSFLLIGEGGTHKTFFIGTCPLPAFVFDLDDGMAIHAGRENIDYETYKELPKGQKIQKWQAEKGGWYEYGKAWPAIVKKLNEIGLTMDTGECKYKTLAFDSLTLLTDLCLNSVISDNGGNEYKDGRQMWGAFLNKMTWLFSQFTSWPVLKVLTAHVKRDDNLVTGMVEKLPNVPGQFSGKVGVYFDEVYYTEVKMVPSDPKKPDSPRVPAFVFKSVQDGTVKQAKSRKYNLPNDTPTDFNEVMKIIKARPK